MSEQKFKLELLGEIAALERMLAETPAENVICKASLAARLARVKAEAKELEQKFDLQSLHLVFQCTTCERLRVSESVFNSRECGEPTGADERCGGPMILIAGEVNHGER